jgi:ABC-type nickel/cobalt efflux system permease component RcnA
LVTTAFSIGFIHTLIGPDHYLPFIALSKARQWSYPKTLLITVICGIGHVLSSIVIGLIGIAAGVAISRIQGLEGMRGDIASYLLLGFGLAYMTWGIRQGIRGSTHTHSHTHADGTVHEHHHDHRTGHSHTHSQRRTTFWWLFIIFVLGPCEPLIPVLMYPAAKLNLLGVIPVVLAFSLATIATMSVLVSLAYFGLKQVRFAFFERYAHALGGAVIALSGAGIIFLGF